MQICSLTAGIYGARASLVVLKSKLHVEVTCVEGSTLAPLPVIFLIMDMQLLGGGEAGSLYMYGTHIN